jgi:hypothetical protein
MIALLLFAIAGYMACQDISGWGWFLFFGIMACSHGDEK